MLRPLVYESFAVLLGEINKTLSSLTSFPLRLSFFCIGAPAGSDGGSEGLLGGGSRASCLAASVHVLTARAEV